MPFTTVKTLLAEAVALLDKSGLRRADELIDVCAVRGLDIRDLTEARAKKRIHH